MNILELQPVGEKELLVSWEDGHRSLYQNKALRALCPCAGCVDEVTGKRRIILDSVPSDVKVMNFEAVGRYAVRFRWSDAHVTGIYSFDYLRKLCPCKKCHP